MYYYVLSCITRTTILGVNMLVKIKQYKVGKRGLRGSVIGIPSVFITDNKIKPGDVLEIYRTFIEGKDALVIIPQKEKLNQVSIKN